MEAMNVMMSYIAENTFPLEFFNILDRLRWTAHQIRIKVKNKELSIYYFSKKKYDEVYRYNTSVSIYVCRIVRVYVLLNIRYIRYIRYTPRPCTLLVYIIVIRVYITIRSTFC